MPALGVPGPAGRGGSAAGDLDESPWLSPRALLITFCGLNLLIYSDRGSISSNGVNAQGIAPEFNLTLFQDGLLPAAFMVGLLASSPVFAEAAKRAGAFRLIGAGLAVWAAAVTGCGLSVGFRSLLACRMAVGVGEASFVSLAAPFIDDHAPAHQKTRWLAAFFMCIPVGYALGFIYGGLMGGTWGWRAAFLLQAAAMLPFVAFCARAPHVSLRGTRPRGAAAPAAAAAEAGASAPAALLPARDALAARLREAAADVRQLGRRPVYAWVVAAMTCYTAVLGTLSFYGPQAARDVFGVDPQFVDLAFGALTVATGTLGTLAGGAALDAAGSSLRNGALLCCGGLAAGGALTVTAFSATSSFAAFACVLGLGQFALFMTAAPSNALAMWAVPAGLRPLAMSVSVVFMHVLGDVPAPPLLGLLQGQLHDWRASMCALCALLFAGAAAYARAAAAAATAVDFRASSSGPSGGSLRSELGGDEGGDEGEALEAQDGALLPHGGRSDDAPP